MRVRHVRLLLSAVLTGLIPAASHAQVTSRNMQLLGHFDEYHTPAGTLPYAYSACWSYIHSDGREYAVLGISSGVAIYNVTKPDTAYKVGFIAGPPSIWREIKQYRNWIYVVTEGHGPGQGLQIIRMTNPEAPVLAATYTSANLVSAHTVTVDTSRAILTTNGSRSFAGGDAYPYTGVRVFSLASPEAPVEIGSWPASGPYDNTNYVHDAVFRGNRLYAASVYVGRERVLDATNPASLSEITSWTYPGAYYTHNSWPDSSDRYLYVTDEQNGQLLRIFDLVNLASPQLVNAISANPISIVHNAHVKGRELYLSNYTEGIRVLDLSDPVHPAEYGWADSYPGPSGGYGGVWEVCPFFPSGTVIASDMQTGLYIYRPVRDYGLLQVRVVDDGQPVAGARVRLTTQGDSLRTANDGVVRFAPSPGPQTVVADFFGHSPASASLTITAGQLDSVTLEVEHLPTTNFQGTIRNRLNQATLDGAEVDLAYTTLQAISDTVGGYHLDNVPDDDYAVSVRRPGYVPLSYVRHIGPATPGQSYGLSPAATWNSLEASTGWTVGAAGDNATSGVWILAAPVGTGLQTGPTFAVDESPASPATLATGTFGRDRQAEPAHEGHVDAPPTGQIKPWSDRTPGTGTRCFITGQAAAHTTVADNFDLDGGRTTLTSAAYDMTGMTDPVVGWWRWFFSRDAGTGQPESTDWLAVLVSNDNGATWVPVDTTRGLHNAWEEQAIHVASYVTPTSQVRVRFVAADLGAATTVEAGIDDITTYDGVLAALEVPGGSHTVALRFGALSANPFAGRVSFTLVVPRPGEMAVDVVDVTGRRVRELRRGAADVGTMRLTWDGADDAGRASAAGVYFVRARLGSETASLRLVRMP